MQYEGPLLVVENLEQSKKFYHDVLGLEVIIDFGANVTLSGGISLQTKESWMKFINKEENEIVFGGNATEFYFEEDDFDSFIQKLNSIDSINYIHQAIEHSWGQRAVRFYDVDSHIIEVAENMVVVVKRFLNSGLSIEETAKRMDVQVEYIRSCIE